MPAVAAGGASVPFTPIHGLKSAVFHAGRLYPHVPLPPRMLQEAQEMRLKLHPAQMTVRMSKARFRVVVAGRRIGKCLAPGTLIAMADGTEKPIEQVVAGDLVLTVNEQTYELEIKPVQHVHDNGIKDTVLIRTGGRELHCTPNHPLLVNNRWVEAGNIKTGDLVAVPRSTLFGTQRMADHEVDFLAIWLAEGEKSHVSNTTPAVLDALRTALAAWDCELVHIQKADWRWRRAAHSKNFGRGGLSTAPRAFLEKLGLFSLNSKTKRIPDCIFRLPEDQLARFLNLFIACDGSISTTTKRQARLEIGLANQHMVRQLASLLHKFGIRGGIRHKIHKSLNKHGVPYESWSYVSSRKIDILSFCERIGAIGKKQSVDIARQVASTSAGSCNDYLPISHDDFAKHLDCERRQLGKNGGHNAVVARGLPENARQNLTAWRRQTPKRCSVRRYAVVRGYSDGYFDPIADGGLVWEEVKAVAATGEKQTYDLTVEGNHNFIANGLVTHNTHLALSLAYEEAERRPGSLIWYVAPTYAMAKQIAWEKLKELVPRYRLKGKPHEVDLMIRLTNGSRIALKGADRPDSVRGVGIYFLVLDEFQDMKPEIWTAIRPTLSDYRGRALFIGTPKGRNHFYDQYLKGISHDGKGKNPQWDSWQFKTIDSPFIAKSEIAEAMHDMDLRSFRQEYEASFETAAGLVYYDFDRHKNVRPCPFDPAMPVLIGQDFNVDPMCSVVIQRHGEQWWVTGELHLRNSSTEQTCRELLNEFGFSITDRATVYPDPAGNTRSSTRGESDLQIFREWGFHRLLFRRKAPLVRDRIAAVNRLILNAQGQRRLFIDPSATHLIRSLETTSYKEGTNEIDKEADVDHPSDALGYPIEFELPILKPHKMIGISR